MIVPMKRLTLVALKDDEARIMKALQAICAVQVIQKEEPVADEAGLAQAEGSVQRLNNALSLLKPYAEKRSLLQPKPESTAQKLKEDLPEAMTLCEQLEETDRARTAVRSQIEKCNGTIALLTPWAKLDTSISQLKPTLHTELFTGLLPLKELEKLKDLPEDAAVEILDGEGQKAVLVACPKEKGQEVGGYLKQLNWVDVTFPKAEGTPCQAIADLEAQVAGLQQQEQELEARLQELGKQNALLAQGADAAVIERDRAAARGALSKTAATFQLEGWVREDEREKVEQAISSVTDIYYLEYREAQEDEKEPVVLKNKPLVEPYQAVVNLYSLPAPGTMDATPMMAPFYFLFFGMMLADLGYGIVLFAGALLFIKFVKPQGMMRQIAGVLWQGGISTMIMGVLLGTFFGVPWPELLPNTFIGNTFPLIDSSADPVSMLVLCFGLGIVHMFYGVFLSIANCIRRKDYMGAIIDNLCWVLIITGLLLQAAPMIGLPQGVATAGLWMAIASAGLVLLFAGRSKGWKPGRFISGAGKLYDVTSWLGDVLSYSRVFALSLSGAVIGLVLNTLGGMLYSAFQGSVIMSIIGFILTAAMLVALHMFMLAINTLGCFVHTARLQYVEFFGKFYEAGGKPFRPLGYKTRHVNVER